VDLHSPGLTAPREEVIHENGGEAVDLSVVIVSWNVVDLLRGCIESIVFTHGELLVEIIVVDNASADGSAEMVRDQFPKVDLLAGTENVGFGRANNIGLERASGRYVLFLNPDTVVVNSALARMVQFLDEHPEFDMVGPRLSYPDGTPQAACRLPSVPLMLFHALYLHRLPVVRRLMDPGSRLIKAATRAGEVEAILGAAMLARLSIIEAVGGFDDHFLHTCEDIDLCRRLRQRGSRIFYLAEAEVIHFSGKSSSQASVRAGTMATLSMGEYFQRFHGRTQARLYRLIVQVIEMPLLIVVGLMKSLLGRDGGDELRWRLKYARAIWRWRVGD
jgi:N-acetylglucosaminyl-diphospho-decaprenol L-rhamnosyltransferase